jgi:hypothetical protein
MSSIAPRTSASAWSPICHESCWRLANFGSRRVSSSKRGPGPALGPARCGGISWKQELVKVRASCLRAAACSQLGLAVPVSEGQGDGVFNEALTCPVHAIAMRPAARGKSTAHSARGRACAVERHGISAGGILEARSRRQVGLCATANQFLRHNAASHPPPDVDADAANALLHQNFTVSRFCRMAHAERLRSRRWRPSRLTTGLVRIIGLSPQSAVASAPPGGHPPRGGYTLPGSLPPFGAP